MADLIDNAINVYIGLTVGNLLILGVLCVARFILGLVR